MGACQGLKDYAETLPSNPFSRCAYATCGLEIITGKPYNSKITQIFTVQETENAKVQKVRGDDVPRARD